jgi:branched-chain amino acid aminotransferase
MLHIIYLSDTISSDFLSALIVFAPLISLYSPVGAYYPTGFKPVNLLADTRYTRAWPGGMGDTKCGGNYAATIKPQAEAALQNCQQVMWLFGPGQQVTEVGTMNLFVLWKNLKVLIFDCVRVFFLLSLASLIFTYHLLFFFRFNMILQGEKELITAPLDGTILEGVTRRSVLDLTRKWGDFKVTEATFSMPELRDAIKSGNVYHLLCILVLV